MASGSRRPRAAGVPATPELCVGAVVVEAGRLLLVKRGRPPGVNRWSVPGGRVKGGETLAEALRREVREETGIDVEPGQLVGWVERFVDGRHFVILDFWAALPAPGPVPAERTPSGLPHPVAGDDASDARWVELAEVAGLALVDGLAAFLGRHGVIP